MMIHVSEVKDRIVNSQIREWRDVISKIEEIEAKSTSLSDGDLSNFNIIKTGLRNRITVYEAALCNKH